jgi:hypothetical protein
MEFLDFIVSPVLTFLDLRRRNAENDQAEPSVDRSAFSRPAEICPGFYLPDPPEEPRRGRIADPIGKEIQNSSSSSTIGVVKNVSCPHKIKVFLITKAPSPDSL